MSISELVLRFRDTAGWLVAVEQAVGKEIALKCERYDDALIEGEVLAERFYYEIERPKVRKSLEEWKNKMKDFAAECQKRRKEELEEVLEKAKLKLADILQHRGEVEKKKELLKDIKKMEYILKANITPEKIERAREYPINKLIDVNKSGLARCINHDDRFPSMNCKNNYVYCHSCNFHTDVIGVYQKINNCGFVEAVNFLSL